MSALHAHARPAAAPRGPTLVGPVGSITAAVTPAKGSPSPAPPQLLSPAPANATNAATSTTTSTSAGWGAGPAGGGAGAGGTAAESADVSGYVKQHRIHLLLDQLIKDILTEKPRDSAQWMLRWFLERHRAACEERHRTSPQSAARRTQDDPPEDIDPDEGAPLGPVTATAGTDITDDDIQLMAAIERTRERQRRSRSRDVADGDDAPRHDDVRRALSMDASADDGVRAATDDDHPE